MCDSNSLFIHVSWKQMQSQSNLDYVYIIFLLNSKLMRL